MTHRPSLTVQDEQVLAILARVAAAGSSCPTNEQLAELTNASSASYTAAIIKKLRKRGLIETERLGNNRRITIVATGQRTAEVAGKKRDVGAATAKMLKIKAERQPSLPPLAALVQPLPTVDRDPCIHCGTRRDIGCKHHPIASGRASAAGAPVAAPPPAAGALISQASVGVRHG